MPFPRLEPLEHQLAPHYPALRAIRKRDELLRSPLWAQIGGEASRLLDGVERGDHRDARPLDGKRLRAVAWNIQRGTHFDGLRRALTDEPRLRDADLLLLSEVDCGLGRSHNRNVARELAAALGLSYAFGVSYLTLEDDFLENPERRENTLALAGGAILSRAPIRRVENVLLPELRDKFSSSEKRLGRKRALVAEVELTGGPLVVAQAHLDSNASPAQRAQQLAPLLDRALAPGAPGVLLGGDLNTSTYDASSPWALMRDLLHKLFVFGFRRTIDNYMTPERRYETPLFELLAARGFTVDGFNDRAEGTMNYDMKDPYTLDKLNQAVGRLLSRLLVWRLRPWNGFVPARLDWFAARGLLPLDAAVVKPRLDDGRPVSDHGAIVAEVAVP
jgi:endonuclease/exonuclease/phosphatase family metal-dependent hydrolase